MPEASLPGAVGVNLTEPVGEYWRRRLAHHQGDSYAGVPLVKFPEDLRIYEHLLWESRANVVIEIGAYYGASALWFRDRLVTNARYGRIEDPYVISIELEAGLAATHILGAGRHSADRITLVEADIRDPDLPARVEALLPAGARCLVVEDSAHEYETTRAALDGFARFVPAGGYLVIEDGHVDVEELRVSESWPRGVLGALQDWLQTDAAADFTLRRDLEFYGVTAHPSGFLQRADA